MANHGDYNHLELPADDVERARAFHAAVFGWKSEAMPGLDDYYLFRSAEGRGGGIGKRGVNTPMTSRLYVQVDSIDKALATSVEYGGRTVELKSDVPGLGWFAVLADTEGNELGLFEAAPRD
ncbi:MAG: VOC family protein [Candidatus Limnocylindrales bacterium]